VQPAVADPGPCGGIDEKSMNIDKWPVWTQIYGMSQKNPEELDIKQIEEKFPRICLFDDLKRSNKQEVANECIKYHQQHIEEQEMKK